MTGIFEGKIPCVVCGETKGSIISSYEHPDAYEQLVEVSAEGYWRHWVSCKGCGLLRSEFSRDPQVLHSIYEEKYRSVNSGLRSSTVEELFLKISAIPPEQSETHFRVDWLLNALTILQRSSMYIVCNPKASRCWWCLGCFRTYYERKGLSYSGTGSSVDGQFIDMALNISRYFGQTPLKQEYDVLSFLYLKTVDDPGEILDVAKASITTGTLVFDCQMHQW